MQTSRSSMVHAAWGQILLPALLLFVGLLPLAGGQPASAAVSPGLSMSEMNTSSFSPLTLDDRVCDLVRHPAFAGFGAFLLPRPEDTTSTLPLRDVGRLMPWHAHVRPDVVLETINAMIAARSRGQQIFFPLSGQEWSMASSRAGLFFFPGDVHKPFALICPGGGFRYVGALHEGFPLARFLQSRGYPAFVLTYGTRDLEQAYQDMAVAVSWIFRKAASLGVETRGYSVWGGSAGARMAADLGSFGAQGFGGDVLPRPSCVVMGYTGHTRYTSHEPATFACISRDDPIASVRTMQQRLEALSRHGVATEFHVYSRAGHGFGLGTGTDAEGWAEQALAFWQRQTQP